MNNPDNRLRFTVEVIAEDAIKFPDIRLKMLIRQSILTVTQNKELDLDEAIRILEDEVSYLNARIKAAK